MSELEGMNIVPDVGYRYYKPRRFVKDVRRRFLERLSVHGHITLAAKEVGVTSELVRDYINRSRWGKRFRARMDFAIELARTEQYRTLQQAALEGFEEPLLDKDGKQITVEYLDKTTGEVVRKPGWKTKYETALRCKVFDALHEQLNPDKPGDSKGVTGVLAVPLPVVSVEAWRNLVNTLRPAEEPLPAGIVTEGKEV